jgi:hypothetical protein
MYSWGLCWTRSKKLLDDGWRTRGFSREIVLTMQGDETYHNDKQAFSLGERSGFQIAHCGAAAMIYQCRLDLRVVGGSLDAYVDTDQRYFVFISTRAQTTISNWDDDHGIFSHTTRFPTVNGLDFDDAIKIAAGVVIGAVAETVLQGVKALNVLSYMSASSFRGVQLAERQWSRHRLGNWNGDWLGSHGRSRNRLGNWHGSHVSRHWLGNWHGDWLGSHGRSRHRLGNWHGSHVSRHWLGNWHGDRLGSHACPHLSAGVTHNQHQQQQQQQPREERRFKRCPRLSV